MTLQSGEERMVSIVSETGTTRSFKQITKKQNKKQNNKTESLLYSIYKNNAQEIIGLNVKQNYKAFTTEYRRISQ